MIVSAPLGVQLKLNYIKKEDILAKGGWHVPGRPIVDDSICTGELPPLASLRPQTGRGQPVGLWNQTDRDLANFTSHPFLGSLMPREGAISVFSDQRYSSLNVCKKCFEQERKLEYWVSVVAGSVKWSDLTAGHLH